jgi:hypothetical protein
MARLGRTVARLATAVLVGASCGVLLAPAAASAGGTAYRAPVSISFGSGDYVVNYDFETTGSTGQTNVDWAMSIFAYNGASISKFKSVMDGAGFTGVSSDSKHSRLNDNAGWVWDGDRGKKPIICPAFTTTPHYRVYADSNDYLYNVGYGSYVLATTHRDRDECGGGNKSFYDSERVEGEITAWFGTRGYAVYHDYSSFSNYEPYRAQGTHVWDNDGRASYVNLR